MEATTRERIADRLREGAATPSELSDEMGVSRGSAYSHVRHVAKSIEGTEERFLVRPPRCRQCGFERFDDLINDPSRCPECKSEGIEEPAFRIRAQEE